MDPDRLAELDVLHFSCLLWGVAFSQGIEPSVADFPALANSVARARGLADTGDQVLSLQGFSSDPSSNTPSMTVATIS